MVTEAVVLLKFSFCVLLKTHTSLENMRVYRISIWGRTVPLRRTITAHGFYYSQNRNKIVNIWILSLFKSSTFFQLNLTKFKHSTNCTWYRCIWQASCHFHWSADREQGTIMLREGPYEVLQSDLPVWQWRMSGSCKTYLTDRITNQTRSNVMSTR